MWQSIVFWAVFAAAVVVAVWVCRTKGWRRAAGLVVAIVAVAAGLLNATLLPVTQFGLAIMNYRWLWATAAYVLMLVLVEAERWSRRRLDSPTAQTAVLVGLALMCVVPAIATIPRSVQYETADVYLAEQSNVEEMLGQVDDRLAALADSGPIVIDESGMYFGHGYTYPLLVAMQEHGIDFRFDARYQERRFGEGRLSDGSETRRLRLVSGDEARRRRDDVGLLAFVDDPDLPVAVVVDEQ